jgi:RNA 2',3'-cyclic 3'-phosphodiesterase
MAVPFVREQLWLPRFEAAAKPTDGLFFAIFPDDAAGRRIAQLARTLKSKYRLQGEPILPKRFHVSLYHLGDYFGLPQDAIARAEEAASAITLAPFEIGWDRVISFAGRNADPERDNCPIVLRAADGVAELTALRQRLAAAMERAGIKSPRNTRFTPHITLLYDRPHEISVPVDSIRWTVRELVLVHSLLGKTRYELKRLTSAPARIPARSAPCISEDGMRSAAASRQGRTSA